MSEGLRVVFVLPAKNEQDTIVLVLSALKKVSLGCGWDACFVVADDSSDETAPRAEAWGARIVPGGGVGLGQAMMRGLEAAMEFRPEWIFTMDSDGQVDATEIPEFYRVAEREGADMVISSRFLAHDSISYRYPLVNWIGNRMLVAFLRLATGFWFTDSHGGIRLMRIDCVRGLRLLGRHTYVQETLVQIYRRGFKIVEVPSRWNERRSGNSRVLRSILLYAFRTLPALLYWLRFHYLAILLSASIFLWLVSLGDISGLYLTAALFLGASAVFLLGISRNALRIGDEHRS